LFRVIIHIVDENDNAPIIDVYPDEVLTEINTVNVFLNESLPINSLVLSLAIVDRDAGDNGRVTWKLDQPSTSIPFELVRLTENTGELRTKFLLDRENLSEYKLILEATDHGRPIPKATHLNLFIAIVDENDNAPVFRQTDINVTISEHVKVRHSDGYEVFRIHADDNDQGQNAEISYCFVNDEYIGFRIDENTGIIRALIEFDRQQQDVYVLHVEARDKGILFVIVCRTNL
jgi:hypothetical protein